MKNIHIDTKKEFDKELTQSYPGDSGLGGNTPQDPEYQISCLPEDVLHFISTHFTDNRLLADGIEEENKKIKKGRGAYDDTKSQIAALGVTHRIKEKFLT